ERLTARSRAGRPNGPGPSIVNRCAPNALVGSFPMIAFSCSQCSQKFKVKPEFAGRTTKCATCKQPLTVPMPDHTQACLPSDHIEGSASSLVQAGVHSTRTLPPATGA